MADTKNKSSNRSATGVGGELHQLDESQRLTTNHGCPIGDNQNSLRAGNRGATLLEDFILREKIFHFDHERIPERIVHARGSAAHGYFECTRAVPNWTRASLLSEKGKRTPVFVRFSTVAGGAGSVDTPRDVRGFAVKFYTDEGNWDLVGNNIPVFFIQDAIKFPDFVHSVKMEADRGFPQAASAHDTFWDFVSLTPESTHMLMWVMSDRTLPRSLRMMEGFGVHTFQLINRKGDSRLVKFHWRPRLGCQSTLWDEAVKIAGADPDYHRRDLWESIEAGNFPQWDLCLQVFDEEQANQLPYDILDPTKLIPEEEIPLTVVGTLTLNRNPSNHFAETEQVAFLPSNVVPGIGFSNDPVLQGRLFSYLDTQKSRLGTTNFHQIPINAPRCPFANFQRDGMAQMSVPVGRANYEPNSLGQSNEDPGPRESIKNGYHTIETSTDGTKVRVRPESFADHYSQARMFYRSQTPTEQSHITDAFAFELSKVDLDHVRTRVLANLRNVDEDLASKVAEKVGIALPSASKAAAPVIDLAISPRTSILTTYTPTLEGRKVAVFIDDGFSMGDLKKLLSRIRKSKGTPFVVAKRRKGIKSTEGSWDADGQLAGNPSVLFDAVALLIPADGKESLAGDSGLVAFVRDAYHHGKAIGCSGHAEAILSACSIDRDEGITGLGPEFVDAAAKRFLDRS